MKHLNSINLSLFALILLPLFVIFTGCQDTEEDYEEAGDVYVQDTDGDTIIDPHEGEEDADGDGVPNYKDTDSDDDCISDKLEAGDSDPLTYPVDSDSDGTPDFLDTDSDDNGIPDSEEVGTNCNAPLDTDGDGTPDFSDPDNDGDNIADTEEIGQNPEIPADSDEDSIPDYMDTDSDGDGIPDLIESGLDEVAENPVDTDGDGTPDYLDLDSDGDGLTDSEEAGTRPGSPLDTDEDGLYDFQDVDSDGDGVSDAVEVSDGTDWLDRDSDNDGYTDGVEAYAGSDPLDESSVPDGIVINIEARSSAEYIVNYTLNAQMMDIFILLDLSYSYSCYYPDPGYFATSIIPHLAASFPDANFGVGAFDDYVYSNWAYSGLMPFDLVYQITSDTTSVASALTSLNAYYSSGTDEPGSVLEALYQTVTGVGFDQDCDDSLDTSTDVRPFIATPSDAFSGGVTGSYDPTIPDTGVIGGAGFREGALPVIIYNTGSTFRDPDDGDAVPSSCCDAAGESLTVDAINDLGAKLIAIDTYEWTGNSTDATIIAEMTQLAIATESYWDEDGDGVADEPIVLVTGMNWPSASNLINAVNAVSRDMIYDISVTVDDDPYGFVTGIDPTEVPDVPDGTTVTFTITVTGTVGAGTDDTIYAVSLNIIGNGTTVLDTVVLYIIISG